LDELLYGPRGLIVAFVWGALWGSFANVVIVRLPEGRSLVFPGSHCGSCGAAIRWYDNIPIFSYLLRRGRCRACKSRYSARYLGVELLLALLSTAAWWHSTQAGLPSVALGRFMIEFLFLSVLVVLTFIDIDHLILPDVITLPGIAVFFGLGFLHPTVPVWWHRLIGAAVGWVFVWTVAEVFYRLTGREGLGLGDGKLLAMVGALLGWQSLIVTLFLGSVQGLVLMVPRRLKSGGKVMGVEIPFGPFLALAAAEYLFFGPQMTQLFLRLCERISPVA
jgi:leader peptidase (prepilin peptidase)/N-methyltransferase